MEGTKYILSSSPFILITDHSSHLLHSKNCLSKPSDHIPPFDLYSTSMNVGIIVSLLQMREMRGLVTSLRSHRTVTHRHKIPIRFLDVNFHILPAVHGCSWTGVYYKT